MKIENQKEIQALVYKMRKAIWNKQRFTDDLKRYHELTGDLTHTHIIEWAPCDCNTPEKLRWNGLVMIAVAKEARTVRGLLTEKPVQGRIVVGSQSMSGDASGIVVERDDLPQARQIADYSFGPLQGSYMGRKPQSGQTRRVAMPVTRIAF